MEWKGQKGLVKENFLVKSYLRDNRLNKLHRIFQFTNYMGETTQARLK